MKNRYVKEHVERKIKVRYYNSTKYMYTFLKENLVTKLYVLHFSSKCHIFCWLVKSAFKWRQLYNNFSNLELNLLPSRIQSLTVFIHNDRLQGSLGLKLSAKYSWPRSPEPHTEGQAAVRHKHFIPLIWFITGPVSLWETIIR